MIRLSQKQKKKVVCALVRIEALLEKCGGQGSGVPGPCPLPGHSGGGSKPSSKPAAKPKPPKHPFDQASDWAVSQGKPKPKTNAERMQAFAQWRDAGKPKPNEKPKPAGKPTEKPESKPVEKPKPKPESKPTEKPESKPAEKPAESPKAEQKPPESPLKAVGKEFGESKATLVNDSFYKNGVGITQHGADTAKKMFGKKATNEQIGRIAASVVGAPEGSKVAVEFSKEGVARVTIKHDDFEAIRMLRLNADGSKSIENYWFKVNEKSQGKGLGSEIFGRQVEQAARHGFKSINCQAARENPNKGQPPHNGYYTWPRMGYQADIPPKIKESLPKSLQDANTVQDLMKSKEGREHWKIYGTDVKATFDLAEGSESRRVFDAYLTEKGR